MAGIYIHVPFCKKLCTYCDFYHVMTLSDNYDFVEAVVRESEIRKGYIGNESISSIYFGGGTPSVLPVRYLGLILESIWKNYSVDRDCELTIEINPDDAEYEYMTDLKKLGVNRISLGIQSWDDNILKLLNRRHDARQAAMALERSLKAGFDNVTIDLIYGIPMLTSGQWSETLDKSLAFDIKHLSAYHLTIEPGTVLWKMKERGAFNEIDEEESSHQFNILIEKTASMGFVHYEISNFGKPGYFSRHNTNYWKQVNYIGLGPSAHSYNGYSRQWNVRDLKKYIKSVNSGKPLFEREELDRKTQFNEYIMTSLRTMWGIDLEYVEMKFEKEGYDYIMNLAGKLIDYGLMKQNMKTLVLTNQGKMISDNIISELMLPVGD
ncbi:MAG TPA: radical SAM family heme chaperone HemW [Bacteroidales bacterium]|nr:radical SAM family heme chaperone HemW [Bacteroidales bacterium]HNR41288.1 radical SAM family heme chaperone HemW [Bacteroidales bacterium]HPM87474.1 radical SAM family heme chaperone HemW [Bacteroidales bacterium]HQG76017.1 radical SAM family heme chaperone HemW [Bacteroidales bacterium]